VYPAAMSSRSPDRLRWVLSVAASSRGGALALIVGLAAWGCSRDCEPSEPCTLQVADASAEQGDAPSEVEPIDADATPWMEFCSSTWGLQAGIYPGCCSEAEQATDGYKFLQGVAQAFASQCGTMLVTSAQKGRIALQPDLAAQCAEAFQSAFDTTGCQMIWTGVDWEGSSCRGAVQGRQGEGEACRYRFECQDGLFCFGYSASADGTCGAPSGGGACRAEEASFETDDLIDSLLGHHPACETGQICFLTAKTIGVCSASVAAGGTCVFDQECESGLRCHMGQCGSEGPAAEGGACKTNGDCVQRLRCAPADGGTTGVCSKRKSAGEACSTVVDECFGYCLSTDGGTAGSCVDFCGSG
jgi:hypothetical protein